MTDLIRLLANVEIEAAGEKKPRRLSILAYSGDVMNITGYGPVVIALDGMTLPASLPILSDHRNELSSVIASGRPTVANGTLSVLATLASSPAAEQVVALLSSGVSLQASVGAEPTAKKYIAAGEKVKVNGKDIIAPPGGMLLVEKSQLREISVTPVGADPSTDVSLAASMKGTGKMETLLPIDRDSILREERERRNQIDSICSGLHLDGAGAANLDNLKAQAIAGEIGVDVLRAGALDLLRASRAAAPMIVSGRNHVSTAEHLTCALMTRAGYGKAAEETYGPNVMQQSQPLHSASLPDICKAALMIDNRPVPHSSRDSMIRAGLSTASLPIALGDSANKIVSAAYKTAPSSWRSFAAQKSARNFRDHTSIRPTFGGNLLELGPDGEVKHGSLGEETYTYSVSTFAKQIGIDRQSIINDDASVFSEIVPALARAAARSLSKLVAETILGNAGSFWSTGNANYFEGSSTNLQASSLATAIQMLRQMKDSDGNSLDLSPAVLLVPPELEVTARGLLSSAELSRATATDNLPTGNVFQNIAVLVIEPRLSDTTYTGDSTTAWYLFSDPMNAACCVAFLDGQDTPVIETFGLDADVNHLAFSFRCYHDFGCALGDERASIKSKGAS